jgi:DNA-dependent protein kinase catalytic subunit
MIRQTQPMSTALPETATWLTMETATFSGPEGGSSQTHNATPTIASSQQMSSSLTWDRFMDPSTSPKAKRNRATTAQSVQAQPLKVYRKYRTGELPDIQFQTSGLVIPLQAVAFMDPQTAQSLFCSLLAAVRREVRAIQGNDSAFVSKLNGLLATILKTPNPGTLVARAVMEYLWTSNAAIDQLDIDSSALVQLARNNHLHQLAVLTLESCLPISNSQSVQSAKKARKNTSNQTGWFFVADLYADLDDVDSLRAVLTEQAGCCDTTRKALNAESNTDWKKAAYFYKYF